MAGDGDGRQRQAVGRFHRPTRASVRASASIVRPAPSGRLCCSRAKRIVRWWGRWAWPWSTTVVSGLASAGELSDSSAALTSCADSRPLAVRAEEPQVLGAGHRRGGPDRFLARMRARSASRRARACSGGRRRSRTEAARRRAARPGPWRPARGRQDGPSPCRPRRRAVRRRAAVRPPGRGGSGRRRRAGRGCPRRLRRSPRPGCLRGWVSFSRVIWWVPSSLARTTCAKW